MATKQKTKRRASPKKRAKETITTALAVGVAADKALTQAEPKTATTLSLHDPGHIFEFAKVLKKYIKDNNLSVKIEDKDYPLCGAWKFAGANFGLTAKPIELKALHVRGEYITVLYAMKEFKSKKGDKYKKEVPVFVGHLEDVKAQEVVRSRNEITREISKPYYAYECTVHVEDKDGRIVSIGTSVCSNLESAKYGYEQYAVMGMAQTRTISRAYRNKLDFVLNSAGFEDTPGEEMPHDQGWEERSFNQSSSVPPQTGPITLPYPTDKQMADILKRILKGKFDRVAADKAFTFKPEQEQAISIAIEATKPK